MKARHVAAAIMVVALASVLIPLVRRAGEPQRSDWADWEPAHWHAIARQSMRTLRTLELRDSVAAAIRDRAPSDDAFEVIVAGNAINAADVPHIARVLEGQWERMVTAAPKHRAIVLLQADSARSILREAAVPYRLEEHTEWDSSTLLPAAGSPEPCVTVIRVAVARQQPGQGSSVQHLLRGSRLEPACAYYAMFGDPGARIREWLIARDLDVARVSHAFEAREFDSDVRPRLRPRAFHPVFDRGGFTKPISGDARELYAPYHPQLMAESQRCVDGDAAACERVVLDPSFRAPDLRFSPNALQDLAGKTDTLILNLGSANQIFDPGNWRGPQSLLWTIAAREGHEKFARFWQSTEPPAAAFEAAIGQPLGSWLADRARESLGYSARGSHIKLLTVLVALAFTVIGIAVGTFAGARRSVG